MTDLSPLCALGGAAPKQADFGALSLKETPGLGLASLALRRGAAKPPQPLSIDLPGPGGLATGQGGFAFWTGPDQWMICAEGRAEEDFAAALAPQAAGASVTEQTDAWVGIEITSRAASLDPLLEKLVNIDFPRDGSPRAYRCAIEHVSAFLLRRSPSEALVLAPRSMARALWHALETAAARLD